MRITLQQIEAFVWAARLGGVHAAAAAFGVRYQRRSRSANLLRILLVIQQALADAGYFTDDALPVLQIPR